MNKIAYWSETTNCVFLFLKLELMQTTYDKYIALNKFGNLFKKLLAVNYCNGDILLGKYLSRIRKK